MMGNQCLLSDLSDTDSSVAQCSSSVLWKETYSSLESPGKGGIWYITPWCVLLAVYSLGCNISVGASQVITWLRARSYHCYQLFCLCHQALVTGCSCSSLLGAEMDSSGWKTLNSCSCSSFAVASVHPGLRGCSPSVWRWISLLYLSSV